MSILVEDYVEGMDAPVSDPTAPDEQVQTNFMNKLALILTKAEEVSGRGDSDVGIVHFINTRGDLLDMLDDPQVQEWLAWMRECARCPARRYQVSD